MGLLENSDRNGAYHIICFHLVLCFRFPVIDVDFHLVFSTVVNLFDFMAQFYGAFRKVSGKNCDHTVETRFNNYVAPGKFECRSEKLQSESKRPIFTLQ